MLRGPKGERGRPPPTDSGNGWAFMDADRVAGLRLLVADGKEIARGTDLTLESTETFQLLRHTEVF